MLRLLGLGNSLPYSLPCDPSAIFQPGMAAQMIVIGNQVMATTSNGSSPIGIIDDIRTRSFTNISWNETVIVPDVPYTVVGAKRVSTVDVKFELRRPNIIPSSFSSDAIDVVLNSNNGVITFVAGTELNFDATGSGNPNGFRTIVNYTYHISSLPGDDSVAGSGKITVWFQRMICETDQIETNVSYPVNANLYINDYGLFTTRKTGANNPVVAIVMAPPTPLNSSLQLLWL